MEKCPHIAAKYDEVPNWLRQRLKIDSTKGPATGRIPPEVEDTIDSILEASISDGFEINSLGIEMVMQDCIEAFNDEVNKFRASREAADLEALDQLAQAGGSEDDIQKLKQEQDTSRATWPSLITCGQSITALKQQAAMFAQSRGYSMFSQDKPTRHLPRDHPQVQRVNDYIRMTIQEGKVDNRLVLNFDQVWSCLYEPMKRTFWKKESSDRLSKYPERQKIRAALQEHFGETVELPNHTRNEKWKIKLATVRGYGGNNTVNFWRP